MVGNKEFELPDGVDSSPQDCPVADQVDFRQHHHKLEDYLGTYLARRLLAFISADGQNGDGTIIERAVKSYHDNQSSFIDRLKYLPIHWLMDYLRGSVSPDDFRRQLDQRVSIVRGVVITARSIAEFGLTHPQKFVAPLFAVWNFTNRCNLRCRHCYQSSTSDISSDELTLSEKLDVVDQMGKAYMPMLAISGGEPTISKDLLPVVRRAAGYGMHISIATNGTMITESLAHELADAGVRYVEISLDSVNPDKHDAFRGVPGAWRRAVDGARIVAATEGLRLGIAMCVHRDNYHEVRDMIEFAISLGAGCFAHFNFIPAGRGKGMIAEDISPQQREELLVLLNEYMQSGRIGIISTAPQLGRVCLVHAPVDTGRATCSHAGSGSGAKARVVAKYLGGCGAGRTYVCIEPNGDVTPCVYMPNRVMGNLRQKGLIEIFRNGFYDLLNDRKQRTGHCGVCDFSDYCGGCRARADAYFGTMTAPDPGCIFNQQYWDELTAAGKVAPNKSSDTASEELVSSQIES